VPQPARSTRRGRWRASDGRPDQYIDTPNAELGAQGLMAGLAKSDWCSERISTWRQPIAQGDIATLSSIIDAAITQAYGI